MKTYKILIDKSTIRKNPNAGRTSIETPGKKELSFECEKLPPELIDGENCIITSSEIESHFVARIKGVIIKDHEAMLQKLAGRAIVLNITNEPERVEWIQPEAKYFFEYTKQWFCCPKCKKNYDINALNFAVEDTGLTWYECPICDSDVGDLDLEYQDINEIEGYESN